MKLAAPDKPDTLAAKFTDDTAVFRRLGDEAADYGITADTIREQIKGLKAESLGHNAASRYSKFVMFRDGSCVAQVRGSRRWEVWG